MKHTWTIEPTDIKKVKAFLDLHRDDLFVRFESWTARTFIMAVFAEIAAFVLLVVKYLFTPSGDKILQLLDERKRKGE